MSTINNLCLEVLTIHVSVRTKRAKVKKKTLPSIYSIWRWIHIFIYIIAALIFCWWNWEICFVFYKQQHYFSIKYMAFCLHFIILCSKLIWCLKLMTCCSCFTDAAVACKFSFFTQQRRVVYPRHTLVLGSFRFLK